MLVGCGHGATGGEVALARPATQATATPTSPDAGVQKETEKSRLEADAERLWGQRNEPQARAEAIAIWQGMARRWPEEPGPRLSLARAAHVQGQALTGVAAAEAYAVGARAGREAVDLVEGEARVQARYWSLANRVAAARHGGYADYVDGYQGMLTAARELIGHGCTEDHGGPARVLATLLAAPPIYSLRDLPRARGLFEGVIADNPRHLASRVVFAQVYAVAAQDLPLFKEQLRQVMAATPSSVDDQLAQAAAERLLLRAPALFE